MLQALSFRPKMERWLACTYSVISFRIGGLASCEIRPFAACQSCLLTWFATQARVSVGDGGAPMNMSGLNCVESCLTCNLRSRSFFCDLSPESIEAFNQIKHAAVFPEHAADGEVSNGTVRVRLAMTHEEISQLVGTSRETITRLLSEFRRNDTAELKGSMLIIHNPPALRSMVRA